MVADWLFLHQIPYRYAASYDDKYKPSFIIDNDSQVILDLVTLNENGSSIYGAQYVRNIKWRRRLHEKDSTIRIEMCSYE